MEKRGLSGVVTAVILIGLSIALIGIIWTVISNLVNTGLSEAENDLSKLDLNIIDGSISNSSLTDFTIKIDRGYDENNLKKIKFILYTEENSYEKTIENNLEAGEGKTYEFTTNEFSEIINIYNLKEISVTPIIEKEGKEKTLTISDTHIFNFLAP